MEEEDEDCVVETEGSDDLVEIESEDDSVETENGDDFAAIYDENLLGPAIRFPISVYQIILAHHWSIQTTDGLHVTQLKDPEYQLRGIYAGPEKT